MSILKTVARCTYNLRLKVMGVCLILFLMPMIAGKTLAKQTLSQQEYQIRAVFLFNFAQFIDWPPVAFPNENSPLVIGVLGQDPFGYLLNETMLGEEINGHPLVVKRFGKVEEIETCHILYINLTKQDQLKHVFESLKNQNVLTVGDAANFAKQGGMIRFFTENGKTRIRINLESTKEADLVISSKLLRLAEIVGSQNK